MVEVEGEKSRRERELQKKMVKTTTEAGICMKTNKKMTISPTQKRTFLHTSMTFLQSNS